MWKINSKIINFFLTSFVCKNKANTELRWLRIHLLPTLEVFCTSIQYEQYYTSGRYGINQFNLGNFKQIIGYRLVNLLYQ